MRPRSRRSARRRKARFGAPNIVFNNAGVGAGGLIWENTAADWAWVLGVNVMGVAHGIRVFTPMMLEAAAKDPSYEGHIVNTASMAGLLNPPNMGVYNVSKHAVVAMSETLYQDLQLVTEQIGASVLCPFFVPTGISDSQRNRPDALAADKPTKSQLIGRAMNDRAVGSGKVSAADVARFVFDAIGERRFYIYSHPKALGSVQTRLEDIMQASNPTDPFAGKPEIGAELRAACAARLSRSCTLRRRCASAARPSRACTGRPVAASTTTRLTLRGCAASAARRRLEAERRGRAAACRPGGHRLVVAHDEVVVQRDAVVLARLDGGDVALLGDRPVRGEPLRRAGRRRDGGDEAVALVRDGDIDRRRRASRRRAPWRATSRCDRGRRRRPAACS